MNVDFEVMVRQKLDEFLLSRGFQFDQLVVLSSEMKVAVLYTSPKHKIAIYRSVRDGEVNCLIGKVDATVGGLGDGKSWVFLSSLLTGGRELSIEELLARVPSAPKGATEQLDEIADSLRRHFYEVIDGA